MRRSWSIVQVATIMLGALAVPSTSAYAAPDCQAVADGMKEMESNLTLAWQEKNAGGEEDLARIHAKSVTDSLGSIPTGAFACLNADGKMRFLVLGSKANVLLAALTQSSTVIKINLSNAREIIRMGSQYRAANQVYWRAINDDYAKVQRRYAEVARVESNAALAKRRADYERRQAVLRTLHGHDTGTRAQAVANMDAKTPAPRSRASGRTSGTSAPQSPKCVRPNVAATTIRAIEPDSPPMALQNGISGVVQVIVSLNADSKVTGTRVQSSPSAILNDAALSAARNSTFQTEIRDCNPIAADYVFAVDFSSQ
jgi:TonB family protein